MKIGFYKFGLGNQKVNTLFGGMYKDFFDSISRQSGFEAVYLSNKDDLKNIDVIVLPMGSGQDSESCKIMDIFKGPVVLYVPPAIIWFKKELLKRWTDKILFVYNTDESTYSLKKYEEIGINYTTLPFASNNEFFKPLKIKDKIYDVMFAGSALSGTGRYKYTDKLIRKAKEKNWKILLIGSGWEKYGFPLQLIAHGELMNLVYNSSKICVNISNDEQKLGEDKCLDLNNRVFDLAMAGCFQISNAPNVIRKYFSEEEVCAVDEPDQWVKAIEQYLSDEKAREKMSEKARMKALDQHTWDNRAKKMVEKITSSLPNFDKKNKISFLIKLRRKIDCLGFSSFFFKFKLAINLIYSKIK